MADFLIRGIPEPLYESLKTTALNEDLSLRALILHLLEQPYIPSEVHRYLNAVHQDDYQLNQVIKQNNELLELIIDEMEDNKYEAT